LGKCVKRLPGDLLFAQTLFGRCQTFLNDFKIVDAIAEFNDQFGQSNHVLDLKTQRASVPPTEFFKFRPLFFGHADVELKCFFGHRLSVPDEKFELMRKYD